MPFPPEVIELFGVIAAGAGSAFLGGKNSLNGFKNEVRGRFDTIEHRFDSVDTRLAALSKTDGTHEARLSQLEADCKCLEKVE